MDSGRKSRSLVGQATLQGALLTFCATVGAYHAATAISVRRIQMTSALNHQTPRIANAAGLRSRLAGSSTGAGFNHMLSPHNAKRQMTRIVKPAGSCQR